MRSDDDSSPSAASDAVVLAAARIAEDLVSRCLPSEEAIFAFAASAVRAAQISDRRATPLAVELATGLVDNVPPGRVWSETRGRLSTTKLFAWLLSQSQAEADLYGAADGPRAEIGSPVGRPGLEPGTDGL